MAPLTTVFIRCVCDWSARVAAMASAAISAIDTRDGTMNFQMNGQSDGRAQLRLT